MDEIEEVFVDVLPTLTVGHLRQAMKDLPDDTPVTGYLASVEVDGLPCAVDRYVNMTGVSIHTAGDDSAILTFEVEDTWDARQF